MANTNGMQTSVEKSPFSGLHFQDVKEAVEKARDSATRTVHQAEETAKEHPKTTAALLLGLGGLMGAGLYAVLRPTPTLSELMMRALERRAGEARTALRTGLKAARRAIH